MIRKIKVTVTLAGSAGAASGNGNFSTPLNGRVLAVYIDPGSQPSTLDVTIKATAPDMTILTATDVAAAAWYYPRTQVQGPTGTGLTYDGTRTVNEALPVDGEINVAGAQGDAGTFDVYLMLLER